MKHSIRFFFAALISVGMSQNVHAQASACPSVNAGPDVTICGGCTTLNATVQGTLGTNTYTVQSIPYNPYPYTGANQVLINIDDTWSGVINLPFCFEFFGQTYNQYLIGSNSIITFDLTQANAYCQWPINNAIPSNQNPMNSIMAPWEDIDPSQGNTACDISWQVYGNAPCREMVISWDSVSLFDCWSTNWCTSQLVLHETTNIIDIYCERKELCTSWNGGAAIEGIQDATGTTAYVVPGRNYPTQWTANNDGWRFMPSGPPNYTFSWLDPSNNVISNNLSVTVCPGQTTTYTAQVVNTTCGPPVTVTDQVTVTVNAGNLNVAMSQTPDQCGAGNGTATATPTGNGPFTYSWSPGGGTTQTISGLTAGTYSCTVTDANGCTVTQTVVVASSSAINITLSAQSNVSCNGGNNGSATVTPNGGQAPYTYSWNPTGQTTQTASNLPQGSYTATVTDANGCFSTQTVTITQPAALTATGTPTNITCFGGGNGSATATPAGGTGTYTYQWQPGGQTTQTATGLSAGTYTCTITDANGCTTTQQVTITEPPQLTSNITNVVSTLCNQPNGSATVTANGGTGAYTYSWAPSGGNGATASNLIQGNYTVTVTDVNGCVSTSTVNIPASNGPVATFTGIDTTGCAPICVQFTNTSAAAVSCSWDFGDNTTSTNCNPTHCYNTAGTYNVTLTITDATGCTGSSTHNNMVQVYPQPTAAFTASPDSASEFDPVVQFTDQSSSATTWLWIFGDTAQSTSTLQDPVHTYPDTGAYMVTLIVSNSFGCMDTITGEIYIKPEFTFFAPNAFTPNGDGKNEFFIPLGTDINEASFQMWIFDRWGNLIFQTNDFHKGWDGRVQGHPDICQEDVYVWKAQFKDLLGKKHKYIGHVSLIK